MGYVHMYVCEIIAACHMIAWKFEFSASRIIRAQTFYINGGKFEQSSGCKVIVKARYNKERDSVLIVMLL